MALLAVRLQPLNPARFHGGGRNIEYRNLKQIQNGGARRPGRRVGRARGLIIAADGGERGFFTTKSRRHEEEERGRGK
jgi:hypothetical protein